MWARDGNLCELSSRQVSLSVLCLKIKDMYRCQHDICALVLPANRLLCHKTRNNPNPVGDATKNEQRWKQKGGLCSLRTFGINIIKIKS
ncbi:hypothetical protein VTJ04DRAFT_4191 [Mycothermus thermophilus]|uniref:uncharacterized protein n=1 Tax=Humicola insolens TaxID=85995 RepID=UPI003742D4EF